MREILFRGKRVDNGEWIEGNLYESKMSGCYIIIPQVKVRQKDGAVIGDTFTVHEVAHETVGQFTGLTDKNGKRIFEGDIVKVGVYYYCGCYPHTETRVLEVKIPDFYCWQKDGMEVIGNIHDNPELLEDKR